MDIQQNVPLSGHSTMKLGGNASYLAEVHERMDIPKFIDWAVEHQQPVIMIGDGSNIIWRDEGFPGLILVNKLKGFESLQVDDQTSYVSAAAGERWDDLVAKTVDENMYGIELLSYIPGTVGGAPVQNIGAYGAQLSDVLSTIEAYDLHTRQFVNMRSSEAEFGYRTSRFKTTDRNRFLITKITLRVSKSVLNPGETYHSLDTYLKEHNITARDPKTIREAVIAIRKEKLPDPAVFPNCGSFFANPIIDRNHLNQILAANPDLNNWHSRFIWELPDGKVKIAAGALLEHEGFKDHFDEATGMSTWGKQALVLVNTKARSTADLLAFRQKILTTIQTKFGITLEQEPELLP